MHKKAVIKPGDKFKDWTVIEEAESKFYLNPQNSAVASRIFLCKCKCGTVKNVSLSDLHRKGSRRHCYDCHLKEIRENPGITVNPKTRSIYNIWGKMKARCTDPKNNRYHLYGARGIKVCERWVNSFENFFQDMGNRPKGLQLDRIDPDGNYCKENCRWVTPAENNANRRDSIRHRDKYILVRKDLLCECCYKKATGQL